MNLEELREALRYRTGYGARDTVDDARLNAYLNQAVRKVAGEVPSGVVAQEFRFMLEQDIATSTISCHSSDGVAFALVTTTATFTNLSDRRYNGRWIHITDTDGVVHTRRVMSVQRESVSTWSTSDGLSGVHDTIYVDRPWINNTDAALSYRVTTKDYSIPGHFQDVLSVVIDPEDGYFEIPHNVTPQELERMRLGQWEASGAPQAFALGDFQQLRTPHDTPTVAAHASETWGDSNVDGPAGTFSYRYCLVRGAMNAQSSPLSDRTGAQPSPSSKMGIPRIISAPSKPSAQLAATWTGAAISVVSIDQGYPEILQND
ncbi:unnamed protein product, partial [marine sediment metagenome]